MERPIRIECREAREHNARCLVDLIELRTFSMQGRPVPNSPYFNQQLANLKAHIKEATRWSIQCDSHSYPRNFVNKLKPKDAETLTWRIDVVAVKVALGLELASTAILCMLANCACCNNYSARRARGGRLDRWRIKSTSDGDGSTRCQFQPADRKEYPRLVANDQQSNALARRIEVYNSTLAITRGRGADAARRFTRHAMGSCDRLGYGTAYQRLTDSLSLTMVAHHQTRSLTH
jgi:hypothetical protein